jgi:hypothetical protein
MAVLSLDKVAKVATIPLVKPKTREIDELSTKPFGCEGEEIAKQFEGAKHHLETWLKLESIAESVRVIHPDVFRQRDENGLPVFLPFNLDGHGLTSIVAGDGYTKFEGGFGSRLEEYYNDVPLTMRKIGQARYKKDHPPISRLYKCLFAVGMVLSVALAMAGFFWGHSGLYIAGAILFVISVFAEALGISAQAESERVYKAEHEKLKCSVSAKFQGVIPEEQRKLIREYGLKKYFDRIFLLTECQCDVQYKVIPAPIRIDPLIIGIRNKDDRFFLVSQFDLQPLEQNVADEALFLNSGIDWDKLLQS